MSPQSKSIVLASVIIVVIVAAAGFWYWSKRKAQEPIESGVTNVIKTKDGLGAEAFKKSNNPLSNELPETNPFTVDTNPFK